MRKESFYPYNRKPEYNEKNNDYLEKAKDIYNQEDRQNEILDQIEKYEEALDSGEFREVYIKNYSNNPDNFFSEENINWLTTVPQSTRLYLFSHILRAVHIDQESIKLIFKKFPEDLAAISILFEKNLGSANSSNDFFLFSVSAYDIEQMNPRIKSLYQIKQYKEINDRRIKSANLAMGQDNIPYKERFKEFGPDIIEDLSNYFKEMHETNYSGEQLMDPSQLFTKNFDKLSNNQKTSFLKKNLAYIHNSQLAEEVFNSVFTEESVKRNNTNNYFNSAHSIVYKSHQPFSSYNASQEYFNTKMESSAFRSNKINEQYAYHKTIIAILEKIKNIPAQQKENVETILEFWDKNRNPIFANAVTDALSQQDPQYTAKLAMEMMRNNKDSKRHLTALLYRLELGKINISKEGAQYLEKMYDLGEYNNENCHIERLTNEGEIGVFDEDKTLIKYFHLGDLDSPEKKIRAKLFDISYETLFIGRPDESKAEKQERLKYVEEFKKNYHKIANDKVFTETGIRLNNLSFKEQGWFLIYFNQANTKEKDRLRNFVKKQGEEGIKTFLSLEEAGSKASQNILTIAEKLSANETEIIFRKFNEVASLAKETDQFLQDKLFTNQTDKEKIQFYRIKHELLKKAYKIIENFGELAQTEAVNKEEVKNLINNLNKTKAEIIVLAATLQAAKNGNFEITIDDLSALSLNTKDYGSDLKQEEKQEIFALAQKNWQKFGNEKMSQVVLKDFQASLEKTTNQKYYILKYNEDIIGFVRFEKLNQNNVYAGSFNVSQDLRGLNIGNRMMENALMIEGQQNILKASASIKIPAGCAYVEKVGFVADGLIEDYHNTGEALFSIKLDSQQNQAYHYRQEGKVNQAELEPSSLIGIAVEPDKIQTIIGRSVVVVKCNLTKDFSGYQNVLTTLLPKCDDNLNKLEDAKNKYTMTRYWQDKTSADDIRYLVFEKN